MRDRVPRSVEMFEVALSLCVASVTASERWPELQAEAVAFEHHRHPVPVALDVVGACRSLGSLGEQPCDGPGGREVVPIPLPRVGGRTFDVVVEEAP
jgi:hypothetical protein